MDTPLRRPEEIIIDGKSLKEILNKHKAWIESDRKEGKEPISLELASRSQPSHANLHEANLFGADSLMLTSMKPTSLEPT